MANSNSNNCKNTLTGSYDTDTNILDSSLRVDKSFDLVTRDLLLSSTKARLYFVDGFAKDETLVKIITSLTALKDSDISSLKNIKELSDRYIPYLEVSYSNDVDTITTQVLSGPLALIVDGFSEAVIIDAREYFVRSISEPESDRVLRGARDGFSETLIVNTSLIRRHIRDRRLTIEYHSVGSVSHTDIALVFYEDRVDRKHLETIRRKLDSISVKSLTMAQESLAEVLIGKAWYNPFPKVRYTERPDTAAATVSEGGIVLLTDTTPSAMLLPTGFFDFFQDTNDYYLSPLTGSYLRLTRYIIYMLTLLLIPTWYLCIRNPQWAVSKTNVVMIEEPNGIPVFIQLLVVELIIDCLKQASLNTPSALGTSFSVVSALILGDFAISAHVLVREVVLYMSFVAVANFAQPSFELGYAFKLCRIMMVILVALFNIGGYIIGVLIVIALIATTPTATNTSYLAPLIPFDGRRMRRLIIRQKMTHENS